LLEDAEEQSIRDEIAAWRAQGATTPLNEYLGLSEAEYELFERDEQLFFAYLRRTRSIRRGSCG
jgi:hypothetical protein